MKKIFLGFAFLFTCLISSAQISFQSGYGDTIADQGKAVIRTLDNGYCIVGASGQNNVDSADIVVYIIDSLGGLRFSSKIGNIGDEFPVGIVQDVDGGFIIVGTTHASPIDTAHTDIFAIKISSLAGSVMWSKVYGGTEDDEAYSIVKTPEDNFLILGSTKSYGTAAKSAIVIKINDSGDQLWVNANSATSENFLSCGDITTDQNYILGGGSFNGTDYDNYLVKMDSSGSIFWSKSYDKAGEDLINDLHTTTNGNFITAGISTFNTAPGDTDQNVTRFDSTGAVIWSNNYGTAAYDRSNSIIETPANSFLVCGYSTVISPGSIINQMVIEEIDNNGNILWANTFGDSSKSSEGFEIIYGLTNGYAAVGNTTAFSDPNGDVFFIKTDTSLTSGCYEYPITMTMNNSVFVNLSSNFVELKLAIITEAFDTLMVNPYYDQYSQNCLIDNIVSLNQSYSIKLYPNPAENSITIETEFQKSTLYVYDQLGRIVLSRNDFNSGKSFDVSSLDPGIYIFELKSENKFARSRFVKN